MLHISETLSWWHGVVVDASQIWFVIIGGQVGTATGCIFGRFRQISIDGFNLFRNVIEGFVEQVVSLLHYLLESLLGSSVTLARVLEFLFRVAQSCLDRLQAFCCMHIWHHLIKSCSQGRNVFLKLCVDS